MNPTSFFSRQNTLPPRCVKSPRSLLQFVARGGNSIFSGTPSAGCTTVELTSARVGVIFAGRTLDTIVVGREASSGRADD